MKDCVLKINSQGEIINRKTVAQFFKEFKEGSYLLTAKRNNQRSTQQNRYWWGYIIPTVKDALRNIGFDDIRTDNDCHELLKAMFFKKEIVNHTTGEVLETVGSTTEATTVIFAERIAEIQKWAIEYLGIQIHDPGEKLEIYF